MPVTPSLSPGPVAPEVPLFGDGNGLVIVDWQPLTFADALIYDTDKIVVNPLAFDDLVWSELTPGTWSITFTDNPAQVDGIREMPQIQFSPAALFGAAPQNGQTVQVALKFSGAVVPTGFGIGPAIIAAYGASGSAGIGTVVGNGMSAALEGGGAGNARTIDNRLTDDLIREEFDWPNADYLDVGLIFEMTFRQDDVGTDRTPILTVSAYLADGTKYYQDCTVGSASDIDPANLIIALGLYSRFDTTPTGSYSLDFSIWRRLVGPVSMPA